MKNGGFKVASLFFLVNTFKNKKKTQEKSDFEATQNEKQHQMPKSWQLHNSGKGSEDITSIIYFLFFFV